MTVSQLKGRSSKACQHGATRKEDYAYALLLSLVNNQSGCNINSLCSSPKLTVGAKDAVATDTEQANVELNELIAAASHTTVETWNDLKRSLLTTPSPTGYGQTVTDANHVLASVMNHMTAKQMKSRTSKHRHHQAKRKKDFAYALLLTMATCDSIESALGKATAAVKTSLEGMTEQDFQQMKEMSKECNTWMDLKHAMTRGTSDLDDMSLQSRPSQVHVFTKDEPRRAQECAVALAGAATTATEAPSRRTSVHRRAATKQNDAPHHHHHQNAQQHLSLVQETQRAEQLAHRLQELQRVQREEKEQAKWQRKYQDVLQKQLNPFQFSQDMAPLPSCPAVSRVSNTKQVTFAPKTMVSTPAVAVAASTRRGILKQSTFHEETNPGKEFCDGFFSLFTFVAILMVACCWIVHHTSTTGMVSSALQLGCTAVKTSVHSGVGLVYM